MMIISIDVSDWHQELLREEEMPKTVDDLLTLAVERGFPTQKLARHFIVARELGEADSDELPNNKDLLQDGGTNNITQAFARRMREIELENGYKARVRAIVGGVPLLEREAEDNDATVHEFAVDLGGDSESLDWVAVDNPEAAKRAWKYLERRVPGHIMGRLKILAVGNGDVQAAADMLHDKIAEMVALLV
jgi:hypothetical protein